MIRKLLSDLTPTRLVLALMLFVLVGSSKHTQANAQSDDSLGNSPLIDQLIIRYAPSARLDSRSQAAGAEQMERLSAITGTPLTYFREMSGEAHVLKLFTPLPANEISAVVNRLAALPEVAYAEPDWLLQPDFVPNDPRWGDQWHLHAVNGIGLNGALDVTQGDRGMIVAVLDTGVLLNHPDIVGRTVSGYDFVSDFHKGNDGDGRDSNPSDPGDWVTAAESSNADGPFFNCTVDGSSWHGTHVAGTIGASINNNVGVSGISQAQILPVRVLGKCGGNVSDVVDGIRWAAGITIPGIPNNQFPARLINMSLGWNEACSDALQSAINAARFLGTIVVASAGNNNIDASNRMPANCGGVITVAATDQNGNRSVWGMDSASNFGSTVEISAPGTAVWSTMNDGATTPGNHTYETKNGTSMATPHVTGVAALVLAVRPALNTEQLLDLLQYTAQGFPTNSTCNTAICGAGLINANDAVRDIFLIKGAANGLGLPSQPYGSLDEAYTAAWSGARLNILSGTFSGNYTFNKELTLVAVGGPVVISSQP